MAQLNTGMGWSAEAEYLMVSSGVIGSIGGMGGLMLPNLSDTSTPAVVLAEGVQFWGRSASSVYVMGVDQGVSATVFRYLDGGGNNHFTVAATTESVLYLVDSASPTRVYRNNVRSYDGTTQLYYLDIPQSYGYVNPDIPVYSSFAEGMAASKPTSSDFSKSNSGYAVTCFVKWKTQNGTELLSPILISSETDYTDMSTTATGHYMAKFNGLLDGVRFYMAFWDVPANKTATTSHPNLDLTDRGNITLEQLFMTIISTSYAHVIIINSPDPYEENTGSSDEEGGDGEDIVDDDVDFTPLPSSMAVASGFITLFCPSQYELNQLANYMWGPLFDVDTFKKLFANPMDCILGLSVYPFPISASGTKTVSVGGISTTVSMGYTLQQYHIVDCGSVYVPKQWGAYMDYAPYTRFNIFLPYIGFRPVSADDIMGKTISLRYMVDILSGACNAELKCGSTVLYSWAGSCAAQIPITGNDWRSAITAGISIAGSVAATVLTQGASAPMIAGTVASATVNSMQLKPEVQRSGSISGSSGFLAGQRPYLVRTNPRSAIPANQNKYSGYPSFVTILLGSLTGYNEVYSVHLENIPATGAELDEIESILKGGAIF